MFDIRAIFLLRIFSVQEIPISTTTVRLPSFTVDIHYRSISHLPFSVIFFIFFFRYSQELSIFPHISKILN